MKLRINASDKDTTNGQDKAIALAYGNKFIIPLDFEMLDSAMPITKLDSGRDYVMNFCSKITKISNISLEYEIVAQHDLARSIEAEYDEMVLYYNRILRQKIPVNKSDMTWDWTFNMPCTSLKGILVLFEEKGPYT